MLRTGHPADPREGNKQQYVYVVNISTSLVSVSMLLSVQVPGDDQWYGKIKPDEAVYEVGRPGGMGMVTNTLK